VLKNNANYIPDYNRCCNDLLLPGITINYGKEEEDENGDERSVK